MQKIRAKSAFYSVIGIGILAYFFLTDPQEPSGMLTICLQFTVLAYGIYRITKDGRRANDPALLVMTLATWLVELVISFAMDYWSYGSQGNFSSRLSLEDSLYFSIGTLTTGTGNISAISEPARLIQMTQQIIDLGYVGFAAVIVIDRFAELNPPPAKIRWSSRNML